MAAWSDEETLKLIEIWGEDAIQRLFEASRRNKEIYAKISREMEVAGFTRSPASKLKKLKHEYRRIKDDHNQTGRGRTSWRFFEAMDAVLGHKPATQPSVVVESASAAAAVVEEDSNEDDSLLLQEEELSDSPCSSVLLTETAMSNQSAVTQRAMTEGNKSKNRKRTRPVNAKLSKMEELLAKMVKVQQESDNYYMRMEEKLLEMEERREMESREFQLSLLALMRSHTGASPAQPSFFTYPPRMN